MNSKRLLKTLDGYADLMKAHYTFSGSHKLPGSKGMIRENAVVDFLKEFVSRNCEVASNVFAVTLGGKEYDRELDIVLFNYSYGGFWKLDTFGVNSICSFEGLRLVIEVKSTIDATTLADAQKKAKALQDFASQAELKAPPFVLFGYKVAEESRDWYGIDSIKEKAAYDQLHLDGVVCPDEFCYFSSAHDSFAMGFQQGISARLADYDGTVQTRIIAKRFADSRTAHEYTLLGDTPGTRLLALAAFASHCSEDGTGIDGLLAAALDPSHNPIMGID
ncbi:DUF6602 domain-containing protein [Brucella sp. NBRC 12950]|uniref:DUF6602 domain-containing protein n=1 Tax=Brucella sp. NBRC 12950 TaxID=2994518 RepID=UPI0024A3ADB5|nr:DUF6602 domain-containing protein [Brucella sp. NBRC 12950]GLU27998.1 hypothetical protein Brsp01_32310 [Brucella sp. NBRC 12950]